MSRIPNIQAIMLARMEAAQDEEKGARADKEEKRKDYVEHKEQQVELEHEAAMLNVVGSVVRSVGSAVSAMGGYGAIIGTAIGACGSIADGFAAGVNFKAGLQGIEADQSRFDADDAGERAKHQEKVQDRSWDGAMKVTEAQGQAG